MIIKYELITEVHRFSYQIRPGFHLGDRGGIRSQRASFSMCYERPDINLLGLYPVAFLFTKLKKVSNELWQKNCQNRTQQKV